MESFSIKKRLKSFVWALNGFRILLREEHNARIHLAAAVVAIAGGFWFSISEMEWLIILLCIALVFCMEIVNSAIENLADAVSPEKNEYIKKTKDLAAAAVLLSAIASVIVACVIFLPKIFSL